MQIDFDPDKLQKKREYWLAKRFGAKTPLRFEYTTHERDPRLICELIRLRGLAYVGKTDPSGREWKMVEQHWAFTSTAASQMTPYARRLSEQDLNGLTPPTLSDAVRGGNAGRIEVNGEYQVDPSATSAHVDETVMLVLKLHPLPARHVWACAKLEGDTLTDVYDAIVTKLMALGWELAHPDALDIYEHLVNTTFRRDNGPYEKGKKMSGEILFRARRMHAREVKTATVQKGKHLVERRLERLEEVYGYLERWSQRICQHKNDLGEDLQELLRLHGCAKAYLSLLQPTLGWDKQSNSVAKPHNELTKRVQPLLAALESAIPEPPQSRADQSAPWTLAGINQDGEVAQRALVLHQNPLNKDDLQWLRDKYLSAPKVEKVRSCVEKICDVESDFLAAMMVDRELHKAVLPIVKDALLSARPDAEKETDPNNKPKNGLGYLLSLAAFVYPNRGSEHAAVRRLTLNAACCVAGRVPEVSSKKEGKALAVSVRDAVSTALASKIGTWKDFVELGQGVIDAPANIEKLFNDNSFRLGGSARRTYKFSKHVKLDGAATVFKALHFGLSGLGLAEAIVRGDSEETAQKTLSFLVETADVFGESAIRALAERSASRVAENLGTTVSKNVITKAGDDAVAVFKAGMGWCSKVAAGYALATGLQDAYKAAEKEEYIKAWAGMFDVMAAATILFVGVSNPYGWAFTFVSLCLKIADYFSQIPKETPSDRTRVRQFLLLFGQSLGEDAAKWFQHQNLKRPNALDLWKRKKIARPKASHLWRQKDVGKAKKGVALRKWCETELALIPGKLSYLQRQIENKKLLDPKDEDGGVEWRNFTVGIYRSPFRSRGKARNFLIAHGIEKETAENLIPPDKFYPPGSGPEDDENPDPNTQ